MFQVLLELFHNWRAKRRLKRWTENLRAQSPLVRDAKQLCRLSKRVSASDEAIRQSSFQGSSDRNGKSRFGKMSGLLSLFLVTVIPVSTNAQTISPVPDPVADAIYSEQLIFGDGWLSEWRASRAEARADREIIIKGIAELKGGLLDGFKGVGASIAAFMDKLISLVKWTVLLVGIGAVLYYTKMIRGFFVASVLLLCCSSVQADKPKSDMTLFEAQAIVYGIESSNPPKPPSDLEAAAIGVESKYVEAAPEPGLNLIMYTGESCVHCDAWITGRLIEFVHEGINVKIVRTKQSPFPRFLVWTREGKWKHHIGGLTLEKYRQIVEGK